MHESARGGQGLLRGRLCFARLAGSRAATRARNNPPRTGMVVSADTLRPALQRAPGPWYPDGGFANGQHPLCRHPRRGHPAAQVLRGSHQGHRARRRPLRSAGDPLRDPRRDRLPGGHALQAAGCLRLRALWHRLRARGDRRPLRHHLRRQLRHPGHRTRGACGGGRHLRARAVAWPHQRLQGHGPAVPARLLLCQHRQAARSWWPRPRLPHRRGHLRRHRQGRAGRLQGPRPHLHRRLLPGRRRL